MAEIIEKTGKSYNIFDKVNNVWNKISFWHKASDCEFDDGKTAQNKLGAINGITSDLTGEAEDIAASIKCVNQLNSSLKNKASLSLGWIDYDFNDIQGNGFFAIGDLRANYPAGAVSYGFLLQISTENRDTIRQIYFAVNGIYYRVLQSNVWGNWVTLHTL